MEDGIKRGKVCLSWQAVIMTDQDFSEFLLAAHIDKAYQAMCRVLLVQYKIWLDGTLSSPDGKSETSAAGVTTSLTYSHDKLRAAKTKLDAKYHQFVEILQECWCASVTNDDIVRFTRVLSSKDVQDYFAAGRHIEPDLEKKMAALGQALFQSLIVD